MANFITILRSLLVFVVIIILFLFRESNVAYFISFILTILVVSMDGLDGYIARKYKLESKFGAVLDIIGDRIVENIYWITFLALSWIPLWIPLVVVTRGIVVDGIRSFAFERGYTAFGKTTMMKSSIGKFLVASNFSRGAYAAFKGIAFSTLILINMPHWEPGIIKTLFTYLAVSSVYISVFLCIVRGLPVIIEGKYLFSDEQKSDSNLKDKVNESASAAVNSNTLKEKASSLQ